MNTIIMNYEKYCELMEKFDGCNSEGIIFDDFKLIIKGVNAGINTVDYVAQVKTINNRVYISPYANGCKWIGYLYDEDDVLKHQNAYKKGHMNIGVKKTGDIIFGTISIPASIMSEENVQWMLDRLYESKEFYDGALTWLTVAQNAISVLMLEGKERQIQQKRKSSHKYKYPREHRLSTESNKIWLFDDIVNYVAEKYVPEGGHHEIQCPCWEVRGHYRHYKSGKVVFIKSFKKGKQKDTAEPKPHEYYLDKSMQ